MAKKITKSAGRPKPVEKEKAKTAVAAAPAPAKKSAPTKSPINKAGSGGNGLRSSLHSKPKSDIADAPQLSEADLRKVKTGLSKKDLDFYRELLMQKRAEILGDVASLETDARNNTGGNLSNMPLHMADIGSDNYEQEFTLGLVESEQKLLTEISQALLRIKTGTYGVCLLKGVPIGRPRLDITPWAKYCIEVARDMERHGKAG